MDKPTREQLEIAIDWLRYDDATGEDGDACRAVAEYLRSLIEENKQNAHQSRRKT